MNSRKDNISLCLKGITASLMLALVYANPTDMNSDDEITEYQPNYYPLRNGLGHESNYLYQKTGNAFQGVRIPGNEHKRVFMRGLQVAKRLLNGHLQEKRVILGKNPLGKR